ncbi:MAG: proton-conducting membrane transporter [Halorientalis sp.]
MTTRPHLATEGNWLAGLAAVALFAVMGGVFVTSNIPDPTGFQGSGSITASIGYAMFNLNSLASFQSEPFLVAFEIIDIVLVAALVAAVMLARREEGSVRGALTDGGRDISRSRRDGGDDQ